MSMADDIQANTDHGAYQATLMYRKSQSSDTPIDHRTNGDTTATSTLNT